MAFFPCIYFSALSQMDMSWGCKNFKNWSERKKSDYILERSKQRERFWGLAIKMLTVAKERGLRLIMENPWNEQTYLKSNFILPPTMIDSNRRLRGDFFVKPTAYWFINGEPTHGMTFQRPRERKIIGACKKGVAAGICSEERSIIAPEYARNFICDFILGKAINGTQLNIFEI